MKDFSNFENISMGAGTLVKDSAAKIVYVMYNEVKVISTPGQLKGNDFADQHDFEYVEMRGCIRPHDKGAYLNYSVDGITKNKAYEVKYVNPDKEIAPWFFRMSVIQSSLYAYMIGKSNFLHTATFMKNKGAKEQHIELSSYKINEFILIFGDKKYVVSGSQYVYDFYMRKLEHIESALKLNNIHGALELARQWDAEFKHKETDLLFNHIHIALCENENQSFLTKVRNKLSNLLTPFLSPKKKTSV